MFIDMLEATIFYVLLRELLLRNQWSQIDIKKSTFQLITKHLKEKLCHQKLLTNIESNTKNPLPNR